jgi:hypothetical protein
MRCDNSWVKPRLGRTGDTVKNMLLLVVLLLAMVVAKAHAGESARDRAATQPLVAAGSGIKHHFEAALTVLVCVPDGLRTAAILLARLRRHALGLKACGFCGWTASVALVLMGAAATCSAVAEPSIFASALYHWGAWLGLLCHSTHVVVEIRHAIHRYLAGYNRRNPRPEHPEAV